jgi:hypothetical protein
MKWKINPLRPSGQRLSVTGALPSCCSFSVKLLFLPSPDRTLNKRLPWLAMENLVLGKRAGSGRIFIYQGGNFINITAEIHDVLSFLV